MKGWLFNNVDFWTLPAIEAYLSGVANDKMMILDLWSDVNPIYEKTNSYFGKPFVWCMLHDFGGNRALFGDIDYIATTPILVQERGYTIVGTGLTMEAIEQNPIMYELMNEMGWRSGKKKKNKKKIKFMNLFRF